MHVRGSASRGRGGYIAPQRSPLLLLATDVASRVALCVMRRIKNIGNTDCCARARVRLFQRRDSNAAVVRNVVALPRFARGGIPPYAVALPPLFDLKTTRFTYLQHNTPL